MGAVQEQQKIIDSDKARITALETENAQLKQQLSDLISRVTAIENANA